MFAPLLIASLGLQGHRPIEDRFVWAAPLPGLPSVRIDGLTTGRTLATQWAKNFLVQGRLIWIDGTANLDRVNSKAKISALAAHIADAGFNTIVFDVKPISGQTLYPSKIAPQIQEWRGKTMPTGFDPLAAMTREAHRRHLSLFVSLNAFSEGHSLFRVGPGYAHPEWQTVLYEPVPILRAVDDAEYPLADPLDYPAEGQDSLAVLRSPAGPCEFAVTLNAGHYVVDGFELGGRGRGVPTVPRGGLVVQGSGRAAAFLREHAWPGTRMRLMTRPAFVPISHRPEEQFPLLLNPNDPAVQAYE
ncbi:MAG: family 10 glycosylhydrolase, partial [Fimbriimonas ginsengisoli]|nr:family 10 glycosylhydrolase [Fimbriimonas ginsengisoli]